MKYAAVMRLKKIKNEVLSSAILKRAIDDKYAVTKRLYDE